MSEDGNEEKDSMEEGGDGDGIVPLPSEPLYSLEDNIVTKSNDLVRASYQLTAPEQRLITAAISKLDSRKVGYHPHPKLNQSTIHLTALEYAETYGIDPKNVYTEIKKASDTLFERKILKIAGKETTKLRWVSKVKYHDGEGWVELTFTPDLMPHLTLLRDKFTSYKLRQVSRLRGTYSWRIFDMCAQFMNTGMMRIGMEDFIELLQLPYTRFVDVKRRVIEPAIEEIRSKSNMEISWKPIKRGRAVATLEFRFSQSPQGELDL